MITIQDKIDKKGFGADYVDETEIVTKKPVPEEGIIDKTLDFAVSLPSVIKKAYTGEDVALEFGNIPEATEIPADELEDPFFGAALQGAFVRDTQAKAEIFEKVFGDKPQWGGVFADKYGNPMIVWNEKPYYVNKPGFSSQDVGTMVGDFLAYIPATKGVSMVPKTSGAIVQAGKEIGTGTAAYGLTEYIKNALEKNVLAPETGKEYSIADVDNFKPAFGTGLTGASLEYLFTRLGKGLSAASGVFTPALLAVRNKISTALEEPAKKIKEVIYPKIPDSFTENISTSDFLLTKGQRTAPPPGPNVLPSQQLRKEDLSRQTEGRLGDAEPQKIIPADKVQLRQIFDRAKTFFGKETEIDTNIFDTDAPVQQPQSVIDVPQQEIQRRIFDSIDELNKVYKQGLTLVEESDAIVIPEGIENIFSRVVSVAKKEAGEARGALDYLPRVKREIELATEEITEIQEALKRGVAEGFSIKKINDIRTRINTSIGQAEKGSPEARILGEMRNAFDDSLVDLAEQGMVQGNEQVLDALKKNAGIYKRLQELMGRGLSQKKGTGSQRAAGRILAKINDEGMTLNQVFNFIFGSSGFKPNAGLKVALETIKKETPEAIPFFKDLILFRAFSGNKLPITRRSIKNNYEKVFGENKELVESIFEASELKELKKFYEGVLPTLWSETKLNPSETAYTFASILNNYGNNILPQGGVFSNILQTTSRLTAAFSFDKKDDMIREFLPVADMFNVPLKSLGQSAIAPTIEKELSDPERQPQPDLPRFEDTMSSIPDRPSIEDKQEVQKNQDEKDRIFSGGIIPEVNASEISSLPTFPDTMSSIPAPPPQTKITGTVNPQTEARMTQYFGGGIGSIGQA